MPRRPPPKRRSVVAKIASRLRTRVKPSGKLYQRKARTAQRIR